MQRSERNRKKPKISCLIPLEFPKHGSFDPFLEKFANCTNQSELDVVYGYFTKTIWDVAKEMQCVSFPGTKKPLCLPKGIKRLLKKKRSFFADVLAPARAIALVSDELKLDYENKFNRFKELQKETSKKIKRYKKERLAKELAHMVQNLRGDPRSAWRFIKNKIADPSNFNGHQETLWDY
jgi:hypothetical protein